MKVLIGVSNFGKISKAEILLEDFVLFGKNLDELYKEYIHEQ